MTKAIHIVVSGNSMIKKIIIRGMIIVLLLQNTNILPLKNILNIKKVNQTANMMI